uniref:Type III pantothenate kinase n=1 Tax=uncultured gamma proteobacterium HF4000_36I10 TaxID=710989 RepID=E0XWG3_9GAMM|nr:putative transcriptional regulator, homolog of bvg accessory factor [uncultured gamma proteobacterium HF4000_36I10]
MGVGVILEFDLGNTAAKWRLLQGVELIERGRVSDLASLVMPPEASIDTVRVASVAGEVREQALSQWCRDSLGLEARFARSTTVCAGVTNAYAEPERLGVDRWLAVLAAYHQFPQGALVVDAGTALTVDMVDAGGRHLGGYILPGHHLMQNSLRQDTARVYYTESDRPELRPGQSTAEAVVNGAALAATAVATAALAQAREQLGADCAALLTGGDAELLMQLLGEKAGDFAYSPDLVMEGLALACPE